jgi:hypothetical protein
MTFAQRTLALIVAVVLLAALCSAAQTKTKNVPTVKEGALIKSEHSRSVYVVQGGERHLIPDPETLRSKWSDTKVLTLPDKEVDAIPLGSPIPSVRPSAEVKPKEGALIKSEHSRSVYVVQGGERHLIPDGYTLRSKWSNTKVLTLPDKEVDAIPLGSPIPSVVKKH